MPTIRPPDDTWRIIDRCIPTHIDGAVNGLDCYVFQRKGGDKPTDLYTHYVMPVDQFWGRAVCVDRT